MQRLFTQHELEAYLEESLPAEQMAAIEAALRTNSDLLQQLTAINGRRDAGVHTIGEIWRRHRISCPTRQDLGGLLLGVLDGQVEQYIKFHLETIGCRLCQANLADLQAQHQEAAGAVSRRTRYFESSAGYLKRD